MLIVYYESHISLTKATKQMSCEPVYVAAERQKEIGVRLQVSINGKSAAKLPSRIKQGTIY